MNILYEAFTWVMTGCYNLCRNYGFAIILFTLLSKIVLLPISIWVQKNSIKMVKIQPDINFITANYFGDKERIAEKTSELYKREKYHPMASIVPVAIQLILLMGVIEAVKRGMADPAVDMNFFGVNLSYVPTEAKGWFFLSPVVAGLSAWLMCAAQNAANVLQAEQSKLNKYGMLAFSVGLSVYLGLFVSVGVALYWVASNLLAIVQLYLLNWAINPINYVDYKRLEESKQKLSELQNLGAKRKLFGDAEAKREKADYKRFFNVVNKHIVFYSESNGFYKYYKGIIEYLIAHTNLSINYVTSDPNDAIFERSKTQPRIRAYYIGEKRLITLMMKMDADIVVMTMPDLENFHIKRSYVRKDIEYIYIPHGMDSLNMTMRTGSMDHFDTVFCVGPNQKEEIEKTQIAYGLPQKTLVEWGYCLLDEMRADYAKMPKPENAMKKILIAPSWQPDNIVDSCLEQMLNGLKGRGWQVTVRPHPQHVRHRKEQMELLKEKFADDKNIEIQTDFSSNGTVLEADLLITDWSGIAYEYAYTTGKPVLFVDTPMKVMNPEYKKIDTEPINIWIRTKIGRIIGLNEMDQVGNIVGEMLTEKDKYKETIDSFVNANVYNLGNSSEVGAKYIVQQLQAKQKKKGE